jgi:hypothetical protein
VARAASRLGAPRLPLPGPPRRASAPQKGQLVSSPGGVPQNSAGLPGPANPSAFRAEASEIRQVLRRFASPGGISRAGPGPVLAHCVDAARDPVSPKRGMASLPAGVMVDRRSSFQERGDRTRAAPAWMVDTERPSARLINLKKRVFSRGSATTGSSPSVRCRGPEARVPSRFSPPRTRTGTPMQVAELLDRSSRHRCFPMRAQPLHLDANLCSSAGPQALAQNPEGVLAFARKVRHGSCLLVHPNGAAPRWGGVNEEMSE